MTPTNTTLSDLRTRVEGWRNEAKLLRYDAIPGGFIEAHFSGMFDAYTAVLGLLRALEQEAGHG